MSRLLQQRPHAALFLVVLVAAASATFARPAQASIWSWGPGYLYPGAGCVWYPNYAHCGGWNYWTYLEEHQSFSSGQTLVGCENNDRIRGSYLTGPASLYGYCSNYGMGGYLLQHATWWSGAVTYIDPYVGGRTG